MKRIGILIVLALAGGAVLIGETLAQRSAPAAGAAQPTKVAVCDIVKVFNSYSRAEDLKKEFEAKAGDLRTEATRRQDAISKLETELEGLKPDSPEYEKRSNELTRLQVDLLSWKQFQDAVLKREHHKLTAALYLELLTVVEKVARDAGYDIVLFIEPRDIKTDNEQELMQQIAQRKVLWADGGLDITETVRRIANDQYMAKKRH